MLPSRRDGCLVSGAVEPLHAVVPQLGDVDRSVCVDGHARGPLKLTSQHAAGPRFGQQLAIGRKLVHAIILSIGDEDIALWVHSDSHYFLELAMIGPPIAPLLEHLTYRGKLLNPRVGLIGDVD